MNVTDLPERIASRIEVDPSTGCWLWTGWLTKGYGMSTVKGRNVRAHRLVYNLLVDAGFPLWSHGTLHTTQIDHLCERPRCVNPAHLEVVTNAENMRRRYERRPAFVWRHGTITGYMNYGCRCLDCRRVNSERLREYRARKAVA